MSQIAGRTCWELVFDEAGRLTSGDPEVLTSDIAGASLDNLFVFSHGWNNQQGQAEQLYQQMFSLIAAAAQGPELGNYGFAGIIWPSIWWPDRPGPAAAPTVTGVQSITEPAVGPVNLDSAFTGEQITQAMGQSFGDAHRTRLTEMGRLIDEGMRQAADGSTPTAQQTANVAAFHALLKQITGVALSAGEDTGEGPIFASNDPVQTYARLADVMSDGTNLGQGDEQSFGIDFGKIWNGAKDALRSASFWQMKARAGAVGLTGLGPLLEKLHTKAPNLRVHLIGHSFGARLVSFALHGISSAQASPVASLVLVQGAFSHWSFAGTADMPFGHPGALNGFADRVHGPSVATFTQYDWAVGTWYPKAAFLARDDSQSDADAISQWGGMGSDGFQGGTPTARIRVEPAGTPYSLTSGTFHNADANAVIADVSQSAFAGAHSDIVHPQIAWLAVSAATPATSPAQ